MVLLSTVDLTWLYSRQGSVSTHSVDSFERGLRRCWTDSFSQDGKEEKKACYGRQKVRWGRKSQRVRLCFKLADVGYIEKRGNLQIAASVPVGQLTPGGDSGSH